MSGALTETPRGTPSRTWAAYGISNVESNYDFCVSVVTLPSFKSRVYGPVQP